MTRQGRLSFAPPERASRELNEVARTSFTKAGEGRRAADSAARIPRKAWGQFGVNKKSSPQNNNIYN